MSLRTLLVVVVSLVHIHAQEPSSRPAPDAEDLFPGESETARLKPGERKVFRYVAEVDGEASVRARSATLDVTLEILDQAGHRVGFDDDSGGGRAAHLQLPIKAERAVSVVVAAKAGGAAGEIEVAVTEAIVTPESLEEVKRFVAVADEMAKLRKAGRLEEARERARSVLPRVEGTGVESWSSERRRAVAQLGLQAFHAQDVPTALACWRAALQACERSLPPEHPDVTKNRGRTAIALKRLGRPREALVLEERVLAVMERTLPRDDVETHRARAEYATTLWLLGRLREARAGFEEALATWERVLPPDHPYFRTYLMNYASTLHALGEVERAAAIEVRVLRACEEALPPDHPEVQRIRANHAGTMLDMGELERAKTMFRRVLEVRERTLPPDHVELLRSRANYAATLHALGDVAEASRLLKQVLDTFLRVVPPDANEVQLVRMNLAVMLQRLGDVPAARKLLEGVLESRVRTLPEGHPELRSIRINCAALLRHDGALEEALELEERVLGEAERRLPADHPELQRIRIQFSTTLFELQNLEAARDLLESALACLERSVPPEHADLRIARINLSSTLFLIARSGDEKTRGDLRRHLLTMLETGREAARRADALLSLRQVGAHTALIAQYLDRALSFGSIDDGSLCHSAFLLVEDLHGVVTRRQRLPVITRSATGSLAEEIARLRADLGLRRKAVADFIAAPSIGSRLGDLARAEEEAESAFNRALRRIPAAAELLRETTVERIGAALPAGGAGVLYRRYLRWSPTEDPRAGTAMNPAEHVVAFVLDAKGDLRCVDLGPLDPIARRVQMWRASFELGTGRNLPAVTRRHGVAIRRAVLDPVLAAAGKGVTRLVVAPCPELHLVPLDALPFDGAGRAGDRLKIDTVHGLSWLTRPTIRDLGEPKLLCLGGIDYGATPKKPTAAAPLREGREHVEALPFSGVEVESVAAIFARAYPDATKPAIGRGGAAGEDLVRATAPGVRFLHIATHGWFAPDSVPSLLDHRPGLEDLGIAPTNLRDEVIGYEPMALCGLALSGANLPPRDDGGHAGLLTGSEIAGLDLSLVELAVLSACDTNLGVRRAGQGIMSLQRALFAAGVQYSMTSLWKVPDEATMKLMTRFYDGIWRRGETKREALWNAKLQLRNAKDDAGKPKYGLRDWAGWVLVGNPE